MNESEHLQLSETKKTAAAAFASATAAYRAATDAYDNATRIYDDATKAFRAARDAYMATLAATDNDEAVCRTDATYEAYETALAAYEKSCSDAGEQPV